MTSFADNQTTPPTLWLIDDDPSLRLILEDNFSNAGIEVISFANAHGAWIRLNDWKNNKQANPAELPNAILTDIRMPMMDGLSFSDWLTNELPNIPVIIMTAHSDLQSAIDSYQTGAFEYLPKPFDLDEATSVVQKAIKRTQSSAQQTAELTTDDPTLSKKTLSEKTTANPTTKPTSQSATDANTQEAITSPNPSATTSKIQSNNNTRANKNSSAKLDKTNNSSKPNKPSKPNGIIGQSLAMQNVFRAIGKLAHSPITVLITGESGTGKELVANALHQTSPRKDNPFIALNMSAIPHELIESELFGHEKGAFTGATSARKGHFELADGGTLFLDEIGDMPYNTQTRLLRVLASGEFFRVGGKTPIKVDVRIVSATHQDLERLVKQGKFREDLFYRLNVIRLPLPALRERAEDIPALTTHFLQQTAQELNTSVKSLDSTAMQLMQDYTWQGNVRQLENACRWITVMASGDRVYLEDLPPELLIFSTQQATQSATQQTMQQATMQEQTHTVDSLYSQTVSHSADYHNHHSLAHQNDHFFQQTPPRQPPPQQLQHWSERLETWAKHALTQGESNLLDTALPDFERVMINTALTYCKGNKGKASELLGWGRNTLTRKIQQLGLDDRW